MTDGKLGLGAVVVDALLHPKRFFEAVKAERVWARPFWFYLVGAVLGAGGTGLALAGLTEQPPLVMFSILAAFQLALSPIGWFIEVQVTHWVVRLFGGKGALPDTVFRSITSKAEPAGRGCRPSASASI